MTERILLPLLQRHVPTVLAATGVISLWLGPTVCLPRSVQHDMGVFRAEQRADYSRLEAQLDQVIWHVTGRRPAAEAQP